MWIRHCHCCAVGSISGPGISACHRHGQKKKRKENLTSLSPQPYFQCPCQKPEQGQRSLYSRQKDRETHIHTHTHTHTSPVYIHMCACVCACIERDFLGFIFKEFFFYGHTHGIWKFPGQELNLSHSCKTMPKLWQCRVL